MRTTLPDYPFCAVTRATWRRSWFWPLSMTSSAIRAIASERRRSPRRSRWCPDRMPPCGGSKGSS